MNEDQKTTPAVWQGTLHFTATVLGLAAGGQPRYEGWLETAKWPFHDDATVDLISQTNASNVMTLRLSKWHEPYVGWVGCHAMLWDMNDRILGDRRTPLAVCMLEPHDFPTGVARFPWGQEWMPERGGWAPGNGVVVIGVRKSRA